MILPGENAPSHRHSSHALRVILEAKGSYSTVNGEKTPMETGDVVLTPGWCWHGHGHDGDEPAYWLDGLDVPLTHLFETMFFEEHPQKYEPVIRVAQTSPYRFSRDAMAQALDRAKPDPEGLHGPRIDLAAPEMPPMALTMERLASGQKTRRQRSTANRIFAVVEGQRRDAWLAASALPGSAATASWCRAGTPIAHHASEDAVLFGLSDEPLMRFAGYYRAESSTGLEAPDLAFALGRARRTRSGHARSRPGLHAPAFDVMSEALLPAPFV